jgi:hypothetical protein
MWTGDKCKVVSNYRKLFHAEKENKNKKYNRK